MIRRAELSDAIDIYNIELACFTHNYSLSTIQSDLESDRVMIFVCEENNKMVGYISIYYFLDEANLQKIRANIYGICRTVFEVVSKTKSGEELREEYANKLDNLPKNWVESYEKAKLHNDVAKILIEETKLEVLKEVKAKFQAL